MRILTTKNSTTPSDRHTRLEILLEMNRTDFEPDEEYQHWVINDAAKAALEAKVLHAWVAIHSV
jgi:hypothetical protein